ncbi:MAG: response regulator transcription factor [Chloroflexota bacterium]
MECIRVAIVGGSLLLQAGMMTALSQHPRLKPACQPGPFDEPGAAGDQLDCDVLILNAQVPHVEAATAVERIARVGARAKILVLTESDSRDEMIDTLRSGVHGYGISTTLSPEDLRDAVIAVARWGFWACPQTIQHLVTAALQRIPSSAPPWSRETPLSNRESEVLSLAAGGAGEEYIAESLCLSRNTVKTYLRRIREKLQVDSRADAVSIARERGLLVRRPLENAPRPLALRKSS